ncbi:MAG: glutamate 5-kinase [bacterium]|nr:glutamate 5-kinase [bacterium]
MRLVIKVGTQVIYGKFALNKTRLRQIVSDIAELIKHGHEVILVSSGAIAAGLPFVHFSEPEHKKAAAAVGQPLLMHNYILAAKKSHIAVGQILLLGDDFSDKQHFKNFVRNIDAMLVHKILPIINENDVMKPEDLRVNDNDMLSAIVATALKADKLVMLTNQDGFYTRDPDKYEDTELLRDIPRIDAKIKALCSKGKSGLGVGGMAAKINAAEYATKRGVETFIGNGEKRGTILEALTDDFSGTRFASQKKTHKK